MWRLGKWAEQKLYTVGQCNRVPSNQVTAGAVATTSSWTTIPGWLLANPSPQRQHEPKLAGTIHMDSDAHTARAVSRSTVDVRCLTCEDDQDANCKGHEEQSDQRGPQDFLVLDPSLLAKVDD